MLTLHYFPTTISLAVHVVLEELGLPYRLETVDFRAGAQKSPEYLALNPKGRVPLLRTPRGDLTETLAILTWLADANPEAGLLPGDPFDRARALEFMTYLAGTVHPNHAHGRRASRWADDPAAQAAMAAKVPQTMTESFRLIEDRLAPGPWVLGPDYSVADAYLFAISRWLEGDGVDTATLPRTMAHRAAMEARPAVQRILPCHALDS